MRISTVIILEFLIVGLFISHPVQGYDLESKLKELKFPYEALDNTGLFVAVPIGGKVVVVQKEGIRNQDNKVVRRIAQPFPPIFMSESQANILDKANNRATFSTGRWGWITQTDGTVILFYAIDIPEDANDKLLTNAIIKCSKVNLPFRVTEEEQYQLAIMQVEGEIMKAFEKEKDFDELVKKLEKIDLSMCPSDFTAAYRNYVDAFKKCVSDTTARDICAELGGYIGAGENGDNVGGAIIMSLLGNLLGNEIDKAVQEEAIKSFEVAANKLIRIAQKYHAL